MIDMLFAQTDLGEIRSVQREKNKILYNRDCLKDDPGKKYEKLLQNKGTHHSEAAEGTSRGKPNGINTHERSTTK